MADSRYSERLRGKIMKTICREPVGIIGVSAAFMYVIYWFVTYAIPTIIKVPG